MRNASVYKPQITVPANLAPPKPGDHFIAEFDPEEDVIVFRRIPKNADQTGFGGTLIGAGFLSTSIASKYGNGNFVIAFKLDGGAVPMPTVREPEQAFPPPASTADQAEIKRGGIKFYEECVRCHTFTPGLTPNLSNLSPAIHKSFNDIVLRGILAPAGMDKFDDLLSEADVDAIHAFLIDQQRQQFEARRTQR